MRPAISEFSYGYALTEELVYRNRSIMTVAPFFPSLIEEGRGGGYDVQITQSGIPLFLQFKLSDYMTGRGNTKEIEQGFFNGPFYRMYVRSRRYSRQHEALLALEQKNNSVFYVAPLFHLLEDLNTYYMASQVTIESVFFSPSRIGSINDLDDHHISFQSPGDAVYIFSEPRQVGNSFSFEGFSEQISIALEQRNEFALTERALQILLQDIIEILSELNMVEASNFNGSLRNRSTMQKISYLAQAFLGCQVFIVGLKERVDSRE